MVGVTPLAAVMNGGLKTIMADAPMVARDPTRTYTANKAKAARVETTMPRLRATTTAEAAPGAASLVEIHMTMGVLIVMAITVRAEETAPVIPGIGVLVMATEVVALLAPPTTETPRAVPLAQAEQTATDPGDQVTVVQADRAAVGRMGLAMATARRADIAAMANDAASSYAPLGVRVALRACDRESR